MKPRITMITLGVTDLERATHFYRDGLGLPQFDGPDGIAFFTTAGTWLSLYPCDALARDAGVSAAGQGFPRFTLAHNVESEEAVRHVLDQAINAGATLVKAAQKADWGGYHGYFSDPDGFLWEVAYNPYMRFE